MIGIISTKDSDKLKKVAYGIILGILLGSGLVYAVNYVANDISYTPDSSWEVNNVNDALDDLYKIQTNSQKIIFLGSGTSFDLTSYEGYKTFTNDDFIVGVVSASATNASADGYDDNKYYGRASGFSISKNYDPSTGILTITGASQNITTNWSGNGTAYVAAGIQNMVVNAWLIK